MLELSHVARPIVSSQLLDVIGSEVYVAAIQPGTEELEKMGGQYWDVFLACTQWWDLNRKDVQAVVEVLAEAPSFHLASQVTIGGSYDPHIDGARPVFADALELTFLQYAQQLALLGQWNLTDLVEEEGASVRELKAADAVAHCPGERAFHVPKELALKKVGRDRGTVDAHQRAMSACTMFVEC